MRLVVKGGGPFLPERPHTVGERVVVNRHEQVGVLPNRRVRPVVQAHRQGVPSDQYRLRPARSKVGDQPSGDRKVRVSLVVAGRAERAGRRVPRVHSDAPPEERSLRIHDRRRTDLQNELVRSLGPPRVVEPIPPHRTTGTHRQLVDAAGSLGPLEVLHGRPLWLAGFPVRHSLRFTEGAVERQPERPFRWLLQERRNRDAQRDTYSRYPGRPSLDGHPVHSCVRGTRELDHGRVLGHDPRPELGGQAKANPVPHAAVRAGTRPRGKQPSVRSLRRRSPRHHTAPPVRRIGCLAKLQDREIVRVQHGNRVPASHRGSRGPGARDDPHVERVEPARPAGPKGGSRPHRPTVETGGYLMKGHALSLHLHAHRHSGRGANGELQRSLGREPSLHRRRQ